MATRKTLTESFVGSLKADGRDRLLFDPVPGFGLRITPTGTKIFVAQARIGGRPRRVTVGFHPAMSVSKAREEALHVLADLRRGRDPAAERKVRLKATAAGEMTIGQLADKWLADYVRPKLTTLCVCTSIWPGFRAGRTTQSAPFERF
jgi:hypothetical protein